MARFDRQQQATQVADAQAGSQAAFAGLVRYWHPRLTAHAWRLTGDPEAARDISQGAWLEIARGLNRLRDPVAFPAWAYRITSRRAAAHIRARQSERRLTEAVAREPLDTLATAPDEVLCEADTAQALQAAIRALPPAQRAAIALHHFEGLSVAETAVALDVPVGTIKTRLMHARQKLKATLQGDKL